MVGGLLVLSRRKITAEPRYLKPGYPKSLLSLTNIISLRYTVSVI